MATTLRRAQRGEIIAAAKSVTEWGYPRPLDQDDLAGEWIAAERDGELIAWVWLQDVVPGEWLMHLAVHPAYRGIAASRGAFEGIRQIARTLGARRLWISDSRGIAARYTRRLGWTDHGENLFSIEVS